MQDGIDDCGANGNTTLRLRGKYTIILSRDGKEVLRREIKNLITSAGENFIANAILAGRYVALGTGSTAAAKSQTALVAEIAGTRTLSGAGSGVFGSVLRLQFALTAAATWNVSEVGVFSASVGGTMLSRSVVAQFTASATDTLTIIWELEFLGLED